MLNISSDVEEVEEEAVSNLAVVEPEKSKNSYKGRTARWLREYIEEEKKKGNKRDKSTQTGEDEPPTKVRPVCVVRPYSPTKKPPPTPRQLQPQPPRQQQQQQQQQQPNRQQQGARRR